MEGSGRSTGRLKLTTSTFVDVLDNCASRCLARSLIQMSVPHAAIDMLLEAPAVRLLKKIAFSWHV